MTTNKQLNTNGHQLWTRLAAIKAEKAKKADEPTGRLINVAGVGRMVSTAYEQLRNAAEYAQDHLLAQNAIRRFFVRNLFLQNTTLVDKTIAEELVIELTQSGYIKNNTQPIEVIDKLGETIQRHYGNYRRLKASGITEKTAQGWTLDLLSIESEKILFEDEIQSAYVQFAYRHYQTVLHKKSFIFSADDEANFEASIYMAVHRSLFKSDITVVRADMQQLYDMPDENINDYANFHKNIDEIFSSEMTNRITRYINKYGAPLRVLRSMVQNNDRVSELLPESDKFEHAYSTQITDEYRSSKAKLNKGLIKSIIFLLITKTLIGIAIEVPFDIATTGMVLMLPLTVNLLTPVVYLIILRLGFKLPGDTNSKAMQVYINDTLYGEHNQVDLYPAVKDKSYPIGFTIAYALMFIVVFGFVSNILARLGFSIVQGLIFFTFLAFASFLGLRLLRIVQDLELVTTRLGTISTIREFLFMPFTFLGKWLSDKYQKINIVALILDTLIELPLKTVLRLVRQWTGFIDEKKEEI